MGSGPNLGFRIYPFNSNGNTTQLSVSLNGGTLKITAEIILFPQNRKTSMTIDGSPKIGKTYSFTLSDSGELVKNQTITGTYQGLSDENSTMTFSNVTYSPYGNLYVNGSALNFYQ